MVRVGISGVGFMGWIHYLAYQKADNIELVAVQSRSEKKRQGDWSDIKGNFGPEPGQVDLSNLSTYVSYEELLADDSIDVVDICLPPNLHVEAATQALNAGKHVFCEKPLALTEKDCDQLMAVASASGKQLLVGQVLPFFPEYNTARALIDSGDYGSVLGGTFKRIISDPSTEWLPNFFEADEIGGPMIDLHVHDAHLIILLFGMPRAVTSAGRMRGDAVEFCETLFHYDTNQVVHASCGVINQQGRPFTHGFEIHLEGGTLNYEFAGYADEAEAMPLKLLTSDGSVLRPDVGDGDPVRAFEIEVAEVARAVESGTPSPYLDGALARDAIRLCHKQIESVVSGKTVEIGG